MATPLSADRLLKALRDEGLHVVEHRSWRTNNRNHKGPWGPTHGVMIHHTVTSGTASSVELCYNGHSALPGPLYHGVIAKDGTVHLVGNGRANHAGPGDDDVLRAVIAEDALPPDNEANTDGNRYFYGFAGINLGDGKDPWPAAQLDAIERAAAALCRAYGWDQRSVLGHLEWQPGKVDPRGFTMNSMRTRIGKRLAASPAPVDPPAPGKTTPTAPAPVEDSMPAPTVLRESVAGGPDLPAGVWLELPAADDTVILRGPCTYAVTVSLTLAGVAEAGRVQLQFSHVDIDTRRRYRGLPVDVPIRAGDVGTQVVRAGDIPAGQYLKVSALADEAGASVTHRVIEGLVWR